MLADAGDLKFAAEMRAAMAVEMGDDWDPKHPGWRERYVEYFAARQKDQQSQVLMARQGSEFVGMATVSLQPRREMELLFSGYTEVAH